MTTAVGTSNQYSYDNIEKDSKGNIKSVVDTVTDALGSVSKTTTNGTEQVLSIKDETSSGSIETTYEYDVNGQKIKEAYSDGSYLTFTYDVYGNNVKKSAFDANGNEINSTEYIYDGEGNITDQYPDPNYEDNRAESEQISLTMIAVAGVMFLVFNIPTLVFGGIWLHYKNRRDLQDDLRKMKVEDLG